MTEDVTWHPAAVDRAARWRLLGCEGVVVWLTGLSGSGKSSVAVEVERLLVESGRPTLMLDGDNLRHGLNSDLGFDSDDRRENIRRTAEVAVLAAEAGVVALVPLISPYLASRASARAVSEARSLRFVEVFVDTPIEECERRDPKGLYLKARAGEITGFTGIDDPYEPPTGPELRLTVDDGDPVAQAHRVLEALSLRPS